MDNSDVQLAIENGRREREKEREVGEWVPEHN